MFWLLASFVANLDIAWLPLPLKKEFVGPGLHLRPVHADHAQHLSNGLWTLCLVPMKTTEGEDPLPTGEPWRSYLGYSSPKRKHTLITPSSRQAIHFSVSIGVYPRVYWLLANCLTVWAHKHIAREWWGYWDCIFLGLCKSQGIWGGGFGHVHMGYKRFSQMLVGVLG